jgi:hypothetical protein
LGLYGDSLLRKFGPEPPDEWAAAWTQVNEHQLARGMRRLLFSGKGHAPTLPEFMKLCRSIGNDEFDDGSSSAPALPNPSNWTGDAWDIEANHHFLAYVMRRVLAKQSISQRELPAFLTMKAAWARDCREYIDEATGEIGKPSIAEQKLWWADVMNTAEQINAREVAA